ncbi:MAG: carbon storage regulator [Planctomycetota bacterium]|nr:carbon storage regulator [Planctomycetota bacterium]
MLILSRREAESISLGDDIVLTIVAVGNDKVRIGVKAPPEVRILRNELEVEEQVATIPFPISPTESTDDSQWQQRRAA